jgi:hypothetical protein
MLLLLSTFIILLALLGWIGGGLPISVSVPKESIAVAKEVADGLAGTAIPDYVLTYGIFKVNLLQVT